MSLIETNKAADGTDTKVSKKTQLADNRFGTGFVTVIKNAGKENEQDVYNDVLQTCVDIISIFRNSKWQAQLALNLSAPVYFAEGDFTIDPFTERFDQAVTGWVFQIGITVDNSFQTCNIPMEDTYIGQ